MAIVLLLITLAFYLASSALLIRQLFAKKKASAWAFHFAIAAIVAHSIQLSKAVFDGTGENLSITNVMLLVGWLIALSMTLASLRIRNHILLPVIYSFNMIVLLIAAVVPTSHHMTVAIQPALLTHITIAVFAYGSLCIAMLYALQLMYINYALKHKQLDLFNTGLPPLMQVEDHLYRLLSVGTILLTVSLVTGFMFLDDMFAQGQAHKTILSIIAWLFYCGLLLGHKKFGWRGNITIFGTLTGMGLLTLAYFGSRFVKEVLLQG